MNIIKQYIIPILLLCIGVVLLFTQSVDVSKLVTADFKNFKFSGNISALLIAASIFFFYIQSQSKPEDILKYAEKKLIKSSTLLDESIEKIEGKYTTLYITLGKGREVPKIIKAYQDNSLRGKYTISRHSKTILDGKLEFYETTMRNRIVSIMSKIDHVPTLQDTILKIDLRDNSGNQWLSSMSTKIRIAEFE